MQDRAVYCLSIKCEEYMDFQASYTFCPVQDPVQDHFLVYFYDYHWLKGASVICQDLRLVGFTSCSEGLTVHGTLLEEEGREGEGGRFGWFLAASCLLASL